MSSGATWQETSSRSLNLAEWCEVFLALVLCQSQHQSLMDGPHGGVLYPLAGSHISEPSRFQGQAHKHNPYHGIVCFLRRNHVGMSWPVCFSECGNRTATASEPWSCPIVWVDGSRGLCPGAASGTIFSSHDILRQIY